MTKDPEGNFDYGYDYAGRLLAATHTNGLAGFTQSFAYDGAGRIRTNSRVGTYAYANAGQAEHAPSTVAPASGPAQVLSYDLNGNMTTGLDGKVIAYDGENRPVSVSFAGRTTAYVYGADGVRLKKVETDPLTGQPEVTLYLGPVEIRHYGQGAAEEILLYPRPDIRIAKTKSGGVVTTKVFALHADGLGSVRAVTDPTGAAVERTAYRPFGEEVALQQPLTLSETRGFIGERFDEAAGLQYLNARYYDPRLAMFTQPDWWEVTKPGVGTNRYAYSANDPVNKFDPSGHLFKDGELFGRGGFFDRMFRDTVAPEAGLRRVAQFNYEISTAAAKYGVDAQGVASVVFQENYWGTAKELKNMAAYAVHYSVSSGGPTSGSFGLTEVQIRRVQELSGIDPNSPGAAKRAYDMLKDPKMAIDLAAKNLAWNEAEIGHKLRGAEAAMAHNMGVTRYKDYLDDKVPPQMKPSDRVAMRSMHYQDAIKQALNGRITLRPDGWADVYGNLDYHGVEYFWGE